MSSYVNQIQGCEVCGNNNLESVLDLGLHPMCDDLVEVSDERECKDYPIEIVYCKTCRTAHQKYQVPKHELFPMSYHYRARFTSDVLDGMKGLVNSCEEQFGSLEGKLVLDIGCNDGSLLGYFRDKGANTLGIEPTGACEDAIKNGHEAICDYLSVDLAEKVVQKYGNPDIITFTNVFAHIEDLRGVLDALKVLKKEGTKIVIENHYLGAVLDGNQFDTFYHEHPRTYSYTSFKYMAKTLGLEIESVEFPSRYGGNIRVFIGSSSEFKTTVNMEELEIKEENYFNEFKTLEDNIQTWLRVKTQELKSYSEKYGKIRAKAFPGRAAILVKMLNLDVDNISAVYEKPGSLKIGHFLPGTRIPIHSDDELTLSEDQESPILNLAWHISEEIENYLTKNGFKGEIIHILSKDDF
jgi:SAM-dependent methyltransferase